MKTEEELKYKMMKLENIKRTKKNREVISDKLEILYDKLEKLKESKPKNKLDKLFDKFYIDRFSTNSFSKLRNAIIKYWVDIANNNNDTLDFINIKLKNLNFENFETITNEINEVNKKINMINIIIMMKIY